MLNGVVLNDPKGNECVMKYPLKVVPVTGREWSVAISDSDGKIIANVIDQEWGFTFAVFVVKAANRWHKLRPWFRPYTREDWLAQRDPWKIIKAERP